MDTRAFALTAAIMLAGCGTGSGGTGGIGVPVRDGKFEFVVLSVDRSKTIGSVDDPTTAQGEFINVHLTVQNTGNEARSYLARNQHLVVKGDELNAITTSGDGDNLSPGTMINTVVSFDVPAGTTPDVIDLHDSTTSGGAEVSLGGSVL
jgi:Domain of unknown function (DUF4352)